METVNKKKTKKQSAKATLAEGRHQGNGETESGQLCTTA